MIGVFASIGLARKEFIVARGNDEEPESGLLDVDGRKRTVAHLHVWKQLSLGYK